MDRERFGEEVTFEEQEAPKEQEAEAVSEHEVDESVRIIREVSASKKAESSVFHPEAREKGDGIFRVTLCGGLIAIGLIMIILAVLVKGMSNLFVGGVLFAAFGLFLDFLTRKVKKD